MYIVIGIDNNCMHRRVYMIIILSYQDHTCIKKFYFSTSHICKVWQCADLFCSKAVTCSDAIAVESGSEADLLDALYNIGPIR